MKLKSRSRLSFAPIGIAALGLVAGCAGTETASAPVPVETGNDLGVGQQAVADFLVHMEPRRHKVTFHRLGKAAKDLIAKGGPGVTPQAMIDANLQQDDVAGSGPQNSVELIDSNIVDTYGTAQVGSCPADSFCFDVKMNSFWLAPLNFTYAQITSQYDSLGQATPTHAAINSDSPNNTGLDTTYGIWLYQSSAIDSTHGSFGTAAGAQGVMLPGTAYGATKTWKFANPDDADWYITVRVAAAQAYSSYKLTTLTYRTAPAYMDPCAVGANETALLLKRSDGVSQSQPTNTSSLYVYFTLPFDFTFWGTRYTGNSARVNFSSAMDATFSASTPSTAETPYLATIANAALPVTNARPGLFPWWDKTAWGGSPPNAGACAKLVYNTTTNTGPNRQVVFGWKKIAANGNGSTGPYVNVSVTLNESTEEIWYNYDKVTSGSGTYTWSATIGAQDASGNVATGSTTTTSYLSTFPATTTATKRYALQPIP